MTDLARVKKIYKLNSAGGGNNGGKKGVNGTSGLGASGMEDERKELEILVLGSMALRGATN
jgi:EKC/KEOPS complex subunit CGI121/TPRKB